MAEGMKFSSLLRVRKIQEDQAAARLSQANSAVTYQERRVEKERALLQDQAGEVSLAASGLARATTFLQISEIRAAQRVAQGEADMATESLMLARQAKKSAEILKERHDIRLKALRERMEQAEMDERASVAHYRRGLTQ